MLLFPCNFKKTRYCSHACRTVAITGVARSAPNMRCEQCGSSFHVPPSKIARTKFCSSDCYHASTKGKPAHNKGDGPKKMLTDRGYVLIHLPEHPRSNAWGYVREHIVVMEQKLGRLIPLGSGTVHHINGVRHDNRPENLELISDHREHLRKHFPKGQRVAIPNRHRQPTK